jgi:hypothetical protein
MKKETLLQANNLNEEISILKNCILNIRTRDIGYLTDVRNSYNERNEYLSQVNDEIKELTLTKLNAKLAELQKQFDLI